MLPIAFWIRACPCCLLIWSNGLKRWTRLLHCWRAWHRSWGKEGIRLVFEYTGGICHFSAECFARQLRFSCTRIRFVGSTTCSMTWFYTISTGTSCMFHSAILSYVGVAQCWVASRVRVSIYSSVQTHIRAWESMPPMTRPWPTIEQWGHYSLTVN